MKNPEITGKNQSIIRRIIKTIAWTFAVLLSLAFIIVIVIPGLLSLLCGRDIPRPDDSDLVLTEADVPVADNSYYDLVKLSDILGEEGKKIEAAVEMEVPRGIDELRYLESYGWDEDEVKALLDMNEAALAIYDDAYSKSRFQFAPSANPEKINFYMPVVALNEWRRVSRLSAIKAIYLLKQGNHDAAFAEAMKSIKIGNDIKISRNVIMIAYLVGIAIEKTGLETLHSLISHTPANKIPNKYLDELHDYLIPTINADSLRTEYLGNKYAIENIDREVLGTLEQRFYKNNFYFKTNQTLQMTIDNFRRGTKNYESPCTDNIIADTEPVGLSWRLYFTENAVGKLLTSMAATAYSNVKYKSCANNALLVSSDILLALKKYFADNGAYPSSLADLSPAYIDSLPPDPFTGQPFRYDPERTTLTSTGSKSGPEDDIVINFQ